MIRNFLLLLLSGASASSVATDIADEVERRLHQNREWYFAGPPLAERKTYALWIFDAQWEYLHSLQGCGAQSLGTSGKACLDDRQRDGKWPWEEYYRDPIARSAVRP